MAKRSAAGLNASNNQRWGTSMIGRSPDLDALAAGLENPGTVEAARRLVKLAEASGHVPAIVESLKRAGMILSKHGEWQRSVKLIERAITMIDRSRPSSELACLLLMLTRLRLRTFGMREAHTLVSLTKESFYIAEAVDDLPLMADALSISIEAQRFIGDIDTAYRNLPYALVIAEESSDPIIMSGISCAAGGVLMRQKRYDDALNYFHRSQDLLGALFDPVRTGIYLDSIAACLTESGEYWSADSYFRLATEILDKTDVPHYRDSAIVGHAISHIMRGEVEAGLEMVYPVIGRTRTKLGEHCLSNAYYAVALGALALNDLRRAHDYTNRMLQLATGLGDMAYVIEAHRLLASIAERSTTTFWTGRGRRRSAAASSLPADHADEHPARDACALEAADPTKEPGDVAGYKAALRRQSRELMMSGLQLARKNEVILELRHRVEPFLRREDDAGRLATELMDLIGPGDEQGEESEGLGRQFHDLSSLFLKRLSGRYPELTVTELKICTLLRSNLSSKEIARMLSLSPHTVDTHRLQIRRKLGLSRGENLHTHLISFD